jgi:hypothetical protein
MDAVLLLSTVGTRDPECTSSIEPGWPTEGYRCRLKANQPTQEYDYKQHVGHRRRA